MERSKWALVMPRIRQHNKEAIVLFPSLPLLFHPAQAMKGMKRIPL
jgi:hypothetical protein